MKLRDLMILLTAVALLLVIIPKIQTTYLNDQADEYNRSARQVQDKDSRLVQRMIEHIRKLRVDWTVTKKIRDRVYIRKLVRDLTNIVGEDKMPEDIQQFIKEIDRTETHSESPAP